MGGWVGEINFGRGISLQRTQGAKRRPATQMGAGLFVVAKADAIELVLKRETVSAA